MYFGAVQSWRSSKSVDQSRQKHIAISKINSMKQEPFYNSQKSESIIFDVLFTEITEADINLLPSASLFHPCLECKTVSGSLYPIHQYSSPRTSFEKFKNQKNKIWHLFWHWDLIPRSSFSVLAIKKSEDICPNHFEATSELSHD